MKLSTIAFRNIRRNTRRSVLSGSAIAIASMVTILLFSILSGMMNDMRDNVQHYITGTIRVRNAEYDRNETLYPVALRVTGYESLVERIDALPGVRTAVPRIEFRSAFYRDDKMVGAMGLAVDFPKDDSILGLERRLVTGVLPASDQRQMLLSSGLAQTLGAEPGDRLTILGTNMYQGLSGMTFTVSGIASFAVQGMNASYFLVPIKAAQTYLGMDDSVTEILTFLKPNEPVAPSLASISGILHDGGRTELHALPWTEIGTYATLIQSATLAYDVIALLFFLLGTTVIVNTTVMVIYERIREIGTVAALGMTGAQIVRLFFLESLFISLISSGIGALAGVAVYIPLSIHGLDLSTAMQGVSFEVSPIIYPQLGPGTVFLVFVYAVVIASLASFFPSRRSARINPVEALRSI